MWGFARTISLKLYYKKKHFTASTTNITIWNNKKNCCVIQPVENDSENKSKKRVNANDNWHPTINYTSSLNWSHVK